MPDRCVQHRLLKAVSVRVCEHAVRPDTGYVCRINGLDAEHSDGFDALRMFVLRQHWLPELRSHYYQRLYVVPESMSIHSAVVR